MRQEFDMKTGIIEVVSGMLHIWLDWTGSLCSSVCRSIPISQFIPPPSYDILDSVQKPVEKHIPKTQTKLWLAK